MQHLRLKCRKFDFYWALQTRFLDPAEGAYSTPLTPSWCGGVNPSVRRGKPLPQESPSPSTLRASLSPGPSTLRLSTPT